MLHTVSRKANWSGHILRKNCLLKLATEGKVEVTGRRGRKRKQLLEDLTETRRYWQLKVGTLDRPPSRTDWEEAMELS